jgi:hypothetical protein
MGRGGAAGAWSPPMTATFGMPSALPPGLPLRRYRVIHFGDLRFQRIHQASQQADLISMDVADRTSSPPGRRSRPRSARHSTFRKHTSIGMIPPPEFEAREPAGAAA